jgi:hypothetical protein
VFFEKAGSLRSIQSSESGVIENRRKKLCDVVKALLPINPDSPIKRGTAFKVNSSQSRNYKPLKVKV